MDFGCYDALGQLTGIIYSDNTPPVAFTYDEAGRLTSAITEGATNTFTYAGDRLIAETQNGAVLTRFTDAAGRPSGIALDGHETRYGYDSRGRFGSVTFATPTNALMHSRTNELLYTYLEDSDLISGHTAGGFTRAVSYEPGRDLIASVENRSGGATVSAFNYVNDELGRRVSRNADTFAYNARSEVTGAVMHTNVYGYVYDPIGNRLFSSCNAVTNTYTANPLNQYTAINTATPLYDADGNMTRDGTGWHYTWNANDRMVCASNGVHVVSYAYDYQGRMVKKTISSTGTQQETQTTYIWDGWNIIAEQTITSETTNTVYNIWGLDLSGTLQGAGGVGGLLATVRDDGMFYACSDANGNATDYIDESGAIRAHYEYSPFGEIITQSGDLAYTFTHRFSTKPRCAVTGLSEYVYRKYSPATGRWLSSDPIGEWGGVNLFSAFENSPLTRVDPLGRSCKSVAAENPNGWIQDERRKLVLMQKKGCALPVVKCTCCASSTKRGYYHGSSKPPVIYLCEGGLLFNRRTDEDYRRTRKHELSHAYDHCMGAKFGCTKTDYITLICSELRAYKWANDIKDKARLIKSACNSVVSACPRNPEMEFICPVVAASIFDKCTTLGLKDPLPPFPFPPGGELDSLPPDIDGSWNRAGGRDERGDPLPNVFSSCCSQ